MRKLIPESVYRFINTRWRYWLNYPNLNCYLTHLILDIVAFGTAKAMQWKELFNPIPVPSCAESRMPFAWTDRPLTIALMETDPKWDGQRRDRDLGLELNDTHVSSHPLTKSVATFPLLMVCFSVESPGFYKCIKVGGRGTWVAGCRKKETRGKLVSFAQWKNFRAAAASALTTLKMPAAFFL